MKCQAKSLRFILWVISASFMAIHPIIVKIFESIDCIKIWTYFHDVTHRKSHFCSSVGGNPKKGKRQEFVGAEVG